MTVTYAHFDVNLPISVIKLQKLVLRDFSLLHPIKVMEALDPAGFEKEEIILEQKAISQRENA